MPNHAENNSRQDEGAKNSTSKALSRGHSESWSSSVTGITNLELDLIVPLSKIVTGLTNSASTIT